MTEPTPGPWKASKKFDHRLNGVPISAKGSPYVAYASYLGGTDQAFANAEFIAAAWETRAQRDELLEALKDIVTQYPLLHGEPVPAWIRNDAALINSYRGQS